MLLILALYCIIFRTLRKIKNMSKRFGALLRKLRNDAGYTLQQLMDRTDMKVQTLSFIETNRRLPTSAQLESLISIFSLFEIELRTAFLSDSILGELECEQNLEIRKNALLQNLSALINE